MSDIDVRRGTNELVLCDGQYAYTQDTTSGIIKTHTGPTVVNVTGQELPVAYDAEAKVFKRVNLPEAAQQCPLIPQGFYCTLWNPAKDGKNPSPRDKAVAPDLRIGQRINVPGPTSFALWPRQSAKVIEGHQLRSDQYVLVRVYDEDAARESWETGVVKPAATKSEVDAGTDLASALGMGKDNKAPQDLSVGKLSVIRGTDVSFYIPPTGVEVVPESPGKYVREALTLERLEYAILIDQNGSKRYERGPQVVFPQPTERFYEQGGAGGRGFKPIELNDIQGLHVKVIAPYVDDAGEHGEKGRAYAEGEELFITGQETKIYFPRPEHSLISYDGKSKHFATAVPAGEARYVMNRITGDVKTIEGPTMLLPDPRTEVVVRRVLSDKQCVLWYPANDDALDFNRQLRKLSNGAPTTRQGTVSEGELERSALRKYAAGSSALNAYEKSSVSRDTTAVMADEFSRGSSYNEPRSITLNNKFGGVPSIELWTNYACMVVSKGGDRKVEVGPQTLLLDYDESLEVLELSTGKPKTTDALLRTVYLRVKNNVVSDIVVAETADHVNVSLRLVLRVNFEGDTPEQWFQVENYVKFLTDHVRSVLKTKIRALPIEAFYKQSEEIVRDTLIGKATKDGRPGMSFAENGMRISDVEILAVKIGDTQIADMLNQAQHQAVQTAIELAREEADLDADKRRQGIARDRATALDETAKYKVALEKEAIERTLGLAIARAEASIAESAKELEDELATAKVQAAKVSGSVANQKIVSDFALAVETAKQELSLAKLQKETAAAVERIQAAQVGFSEALLVLSNQDALVKIAQATSVQNLLGADSLVDVVQRAFKGTGLASVMEKVQVKAGLPAPTNGHARA